MNSKVLVTGSNGFIGGAIAMFLLEEGCIVYGNGRSSNKYCALPYIKHDWSLGDVINDNFKPDYIVHAAAANPNTQYGFSDYYRNNVKATENIISFAARNKVKRILFMSAVSSFGQVSGGILNENSNHIQPGDYGLSKYIAEKLIENSDIRYAIMILPGVVGKGCRVSWITRVARKLLEHQDITIYNSSGKYNNILLIDDLCRFTKKILDRQEPEDLRVLLGNETHTNVRQVIDYMRYQLNSQSVIYYSEEQMGGFVLDVSKAVQYGYSSAPIEEIIAGICEETKKRRGRIEKNRSRKETSWN